MDLILGIIISVLVSFIFSEQLKRGLGLLLSKIDLPSNADIEGLWIAEFTMVEGGSTKTFKEAVLLKKRLGVVYGYNVQHKLNHELLSSVASKKPIRIRANIVDNRFLTGIWYHPQRGSRYHGAFQLLIRTSGSQMEGNWTGFRESKNIISAGEWNWEKSS